MAGDSRKKGGRLLQIFAVQLFLYGLQYGCHFGNADGLEHILVHTGLDGSLGIFKFSIAANNDDVEIRLELFCVLRQLDARHTVHADIGNQ